LSLAGSTLGKYQVLEELGRGGMAVVYKGYNPGLERTVALKALPEELAGDEEFITRFIREARTAAQLKHPNIATVFDVEQEGDTNYIVMEFLPGHTLQHEIQNNGALSLTQILEIIHALADALDYAHERGLTHRDVKPSNVMVGPDGHVTLMDFGIVKAAAGIKLTREGMRIGTPEYMSPEQSQGKKVDHRSDIYSLGVVLYEMLTGRVPFRATSPHEVLRSHAYQQPPPPSKFASSLSPAVEKVVLRALAKRPGRRFQTARQLAAALEQAARPQQAEPVERERRREAKLRLVAADGREFRLVGVVGLGRGADNKVRIPDRVISRYHAQIQCRQGRCQILDLGSVNGTFVNGERLRPHVPHSIRPGDRLNLGPVATFSVEGGTAVEKPEGPLSLVVLGSTLHERVWADKRRRAAVLLGGGIALILLALCIAAFVAASSSSTRSSAGWAELSVLNATAQDLELEIGDRNWALKARQWRTIYFPAGEYDYTIRLENGGTQHRHETWHPGNNGELRLVAGSPD